MKKFYYITNARIPTERAHGIQIMEMSMALADNISDFELVLPTRHNLIKEDPFVYHDIGKRFKIRWLPCIDTVAFGRVGFVFQSFCFAIAALVFALGKRDAVFYTRDEIIAFFLKIIGKEAFWEAHTGQKNLIVKALIKMKVPFVTITEGLRALYISLGMPERDILVASDGADTDRFDISISKAEAREQLGLPKDKKIVLYKGSLSTAKGSGTLAAAAKYLISHSDILLVFIGGKLEDVDKFKNEFPDENISILGNRPRKQTPIYQKAADILVIPNSAKDDVSKLYTSPMKLFGYMAGGRPIIASDLPSIREVLDESLSYFFKPDDPEDLARAIIEVLDKEPEANQKSKLALEKAREYSWDRRAQSILKFMQDKCLFAEMP